jgi:CubicO group peptidase (beta-lactamase class C family)
MARQKALNFRPGEQFEYSNSGYVLLAILVERVSGEGLPEFAAANIFRPLGMKSTFFRDDPSVVVKGRATGYSFQGGVYVEHINDSRLIGDGGLMTTVGDLYLWDQNFYHNKLGKGSPELIKLVEAPGALNDGKRTAYAFGLGVSEYKGLRTITHNGSAFGYKADMTRFPEQNFSITAFATRTARRLRRGRSGGRSQTSTSPNVLSRSRRRVTPARLKRRQPMP